MGIGLRESAERGLLHENYVRFSFSGGDVSFCQITRYTYGNTAVLPKRVNNIVPVNNGDASGSWQ